jgi:hypothetical protein
MEVWQNRKRYNVLCCGRRWGKTFFVTRLICETAIDGYPVGYFAPTYKLLREVFEECRRRLGPIITVANLSDKVIRLATGGHIDFWTMEDPDAGRSRKYKRVVMDEAGMVKELGKLYNSAIRPTLTDLLGDLWLCGTPKGKGWFFSAFSKGQDPEQANWASWQKPTVTNPYISPAEIEEARNDPMMVARLFQQEYEAVFLDDAGGVFLGVDKVCTSDGIGVPFSIGIDLAQTEDFTVLTAMTAQGKQLSIERFNRLPWGVQLDRIVAYINRYPGAEVWIDATGGVNTIPDQVRALCPNRNIQSFIFTNSSKGDLINSLAMKIERENISILPDPVQVSELKSYEYTFNARTRNVSMNAPEGMHDDTVIALALAAWPIRTMPQGYSFDPTEWRLAMQS